jgi:hypothetical protein
MQGNTRRCGMIDSHQVLEGDDFEPPLHPAHLGGLNADEELVDRRKYGDRRPRLRSLEQAPADDDEMLSYHLEEEMEFAECGGPHDLDGRLRNRMGHRAKGGQDSCRHRGPQGWRDVESNDNRPKRRRYWLTESGQRQIQMDLNLFICWPFGGLISFELIWIMGSGVSVIRLDAVLDKLS